MPTANSHLPQIPRPTVVGYCRVSTSDQAEHGWSLQRQEEAIRSWAKERGFRLLGIFCDAGRSGCRLNNRPGLRELLHLINQGQVGALLVSTLDRLSRTVAHSLRVRNEILAKGTDIVAINGGVHLKAKLRAEGGGSQASDDMMANLAAMFAEQEITTHKGRIIPNLVLSAKAGIRGGRLPLGYRFGIDGAVVVDPHDALLVERIVTAVLGGSGISTIVHDLAAAQVRDSRRVFLTADRVRGMLTNPHMTGEFRYRLPRLPHQADHEAAEVVIPQHHPVLIDLVRFAALQQALAQHRVRPRDTEAERAARSARRKDQRRNVALDRGVDLLASITPVAKPIHGAIGPQHARCAICEGPMYAMLQTVGGRGNRRRVPIYQCRAHKDLGKAHCAQPPVDVEIVDQAVFRAWLHHLADRPSANPSQLEGVAAAPAREAHPSQAVQEAEKVVGRLREAVEKLGASAPATLRKCLLEAETAWDVAKNQAAAQDAITTPLQGGSWDLLRDPRNTWANLDAAGRRRALHPLLECVLILNKEVTEVRFTRFGMDDAAMTTVTTPRSAP